MTKKNYAAIRTWGRLFGSAQYYIDDEIERATRDDAPELAIYKNKDRWVTLDEVTNPHAIEWYKTTYPLLAGKAGFYER